MAKQKFDTFILRDKPPKRKGIHKKSLSKGEKLNKNSTNYKGQGRWNISHYLFITTLVS